jgi:hypothetical protein
MYEAKNKEDYSLRRLWHVIAYLRILSAVSFNALVANGSDANDLFEINQSVGKLFCFLVT